MWNQPDQKRLSQIPNLYETEHIPLEDKFVHLHLFIGGCDWFITEFDGTDIFFGYAILNNDFQMAEWGYISFEELKSINISGIEVDCELAEYFPTKKASDIEKICRGMGWIRKEKRYAAN